MGALVLLTLSPASGWSQTLKVQNGQLILAEGSNLHELGVTAAKLTAPVFNLLEAAAKKTQDGATAELTEDGATVRVDWELPDSAPLLKSATLIIHSAASSDWSKNSGVVFELAFKGGDYSPRSMVEGVSSNAWSELSSQLGSFLGDATASTAILDGLFGPTFGAKTPVLAISTIEEGFEYKVDKKKREVERGLNLLITVDAGLDQAGSILQTLGGLDPSLTQASASLNLVSEVLSGLKLAAKAKLHAVLGVPETPTPDGVVEASSLSVTFPINLELFNAELSMPGAEGYTLGLDLDEVSFGVSAEEWMVGLGVTLKDSGKTVSLSGGIGMGSPEEESVSGKPTLLGELEMTPNGVWEQPFGIKALQVDQASMAFEYDSAVPGGLVAAMKDFAFKGGAKIGASKGSLALVKETGDKPTDIDFGLLVELDTLTLRDLVELAYEDFSSEIPSSIKELGLSDVRIVASTSTDIDPVSNAASYLLSDNAIGEIGLGDGFEVRGTYHATNKLSVSYAARAGINGGNADGKLHYGVKLTGATTNVISEIGGALKPPFKEFVKGIGSGLDDRLSFGIQQLEGNLSVSLSDMQGKAEGQFVGKAHFKFDPSKIGTGVFDSIGLSKVTYGSVDESVDLAFKASLNANLKPDEMLKDLAEQSWRTVGDLMPTQKTWNKVQSLAKTVEDQAAELGDEFEAFFAMCAQAVENVIEGQFLAKEVNAKKVTDTNLGEVKLQKIRNATAVYQQGRYYRALYNLHRKALGLPYKFSAGDLDGVEAEDEASLLEMQRCLALAIESFSTAEEAGKAAPGYWIKTTTTTTTQHSFVGVNYDEEKNKSTKKDDYDPGSTIASKASESEGKLEGFEDVLAGEIVKRTKADAEFMLSTEDTEAEIAARAVSWNYNTLDPSLRYSSISEMVVLVNTGNGDSAGTNEPVLLVVENKDGGVTEIVLDSAGNDFDKQRLSMFWLGTDAVGHLIPEEIAKVGFRLGDKNEWACDEFWVFYKSDPGRYEYESPWKSLLYKNTYFKVGKNPSDSISKTKMFEVGGMQTGCRMESYDSYVLFLKVSTKKKSDGDQTIKLDDGTHLMPLERSNGSTSYSRGWTYRVKFKNQSDANKFLSDLQADDALKFVATGKQSVRIKHALVLGTNGSKGKWDIIASSFNNATSLNADDAAYKKTQSLATNRYTHTPGGIQAKTPAEGMVQQ